MTQSFPMSFMWPLNWVFVCLESILRKLQPQPQGNEFSILIPPSGYWFLAGLMKGGTVDHWASFGFLVVAGTAMNRVSRGHLANQQGAEIQCYLLSQKPG